MLDLEAASDLLALSRWETDGGPASIGLPHRGTSELGPSEPEAAHGILATRDDRLTLSNRPSRSSTDVGAEAVRTHATTPLRIMVVEDEVYLGALFGEVLESMGFVVCAIETTEARAIAAAELCKPDIMLVDVQLADGNGLSAVAEILRSNFVPHVFYSGDISGVQASRPGAIAIQKPFRVSDLAQALERALGGFRGIA